MTHPSFLNIIEDVVDEDEEASFSKIFNSSKQSESVLHNISLMSNNTFDK